MRHIIVRQIKLNEINSETKKFYFWNNNAPLIFEDISKISAFIIGSKFFNHFFWTITMNSLDHYYLSHYYMGSLLHVSTVFGSVLYMRYDLSHFYSVAAQVNVFLFKKFGVDVFKIVKIRYGTGTVICSLNVPYL